MVSAQQDFSGLSLADSSPLTALAAEESKKFKIALSNSYIGNKWRIEMENVFKAALQMEPFSSQIEGLLVQFGQ